MPIYILMINPICVILPQGIHNKCYSYKTYAYAYWLKFPYLCGPIGVVIVFRLYQWKVILIITPRYVIIIGRNNKIFSNNTGHVSHMNEHTGEKTYICSQCDNTFSIKRRLNNIPICILMINFIRVNLPQGILNKC